jgi:Mitochondrial biogenesis AIM24
MWRSAASCGVRSLARYERRRNRVLPVAVRSVAAPAASQLLPTSRVATTNHSGSNRTSSSLVESAASPPISNDDDDNAMMMMNPIDFDVALKIVGDESHVAQIELRPGEMLRAESGAMLFMTGGIVSKSATRVLFFHG